MITYKTGMRVTLGLLLAGGTFVLSGCVTSNPTPASSTTTTESTTTQPATVMAPAATTTTTQTSP